MDNRRKSAVRNWLERTYEEALKEVEASTHDLPFQLGPFGETMASWSFMFLGSVASGLAACPTCDLQPIEHEAYIHLDWQLPMTPLAQTVLFRRARAVFDRATALVPAQSKKKYRMSQDSLHSLRNLICLWAQFQPHLETRVAPSEAARWKDEMSTGALRDEDFNFIMEVRPACLSLSMLPSSKSVAQEQAHQREQQICLEVEKQRMDVVEAQWSFFKSALQRDQIMLEKIKEVPKQLATLAHKKQIKLLTEQAKKGEARLAANTFHSTAPPNQAKYCFYKLVVFNPNDVGSTTCTFIFGTQTASFNYSLGFSLRQQSTGTLTSSSGLCFAIVLSWHLQRSA